MPIACLLTWFISRGGEANNFSIELMIYYPSALLVGCRNKSTEVVAPRIKWTHLGDAEITHASQASLLEAKQELKLNLISNS